MTTITWRKPRVLLLLGFFFGITLLYLIAHNRYQIQNTLSYATRPLWDKDSGPKHVVTHYYAEGVKMDAQTCELHGWKPRGNVQKLRVLDAVLMSSELDLLEIRLHELDSVVDFFLIVESNATFTGLPKETYFAKNRERYSKFAHKIVYQFLPGYPLEGARTAWNVESETRVAMSTLLTEQMHKFPSDTKNLVLMSDLDEIPAEHTVRLLKACDFGNSIHLQLRNFMYSFEWYLGYSSWRASAHIWNYNSYYRHSKSTEVILADSGWHCSYCFRSLEEYIIKMRGFSHADRIGGRLNLLDPKRIQDTICKGRDIFGMLPEAYSYIELFSQLNLDPLKTAVGLPRYLVDNADKFKFLLPGGCKREL
ncbi:glycosyltransferase family 17 protein [Ephemerocybe angulata]|uniref:Glycosyltransferase family 17 protein n=1 Tax=Ephemerocybe angulata TaxID=980116 RepID=A0A8H6I970_9AGAR|nr:glycosyltransferase family 17 protein [Tulosesus angulatus]